MIGLGHLSAVHRLLLICSTVLMCGALANGSDLGAPTVDLQDANVVRSGRSIFGKNCSVGYCHGKEGRAGRGPRLRGRELERDYLFRSIRDGIPRSSMPGWRLAFDDDQIWSLVAYIEVLASLGLNDPDPYAGASTSTPLPVQTEMIPQPRLQTLLESDGYKSAALVGDPGMGEQLFFDAANKLNCATCHRAAGKGGRLAPDLSDIADRPAREILRDILFPNETVRSQWQLHELRTVGGERMDVVLAGESDSRLKVYDLAGLPPALRSIKKEEVTELQSTGKSAMSDQYGDHYTVKQLLDLVSFLKSRTSAPARLLLTDLL